MWLMTSKRHRGYVGSPPYVEFAIGTVKIADIIMQRPTSEPWCFLLKVDKLTPDRKPTEHHTFSEALTELHHLLNSPPPEDFTYGAS